MPHQQGMENHLDALCAKHAALGERIKNEQKCASANDGLLRELKAEKLHLKDEIEETRKRAS